MVGGRAAGTVAALPSPSAVRLFLTGILSFPTRLRLIAAPLCFLEFADGMAALLQFAVAEPQTNGKPFDLVR
jgi:hypothetical protein